MVEVKLNFYLTSGGLYIQKKTKTKLRGLSPQANYTDRATAAVVEVVPTFAGRGQNFIILYFSILLHWSIINAFSSVYNIRNTKLGQGTHDHGTGAQKGRKMPQYEDTKRADVLKILKSRTMPTYINTIDISEQSAIGSIKVCCLKMALCGRNMQPVIRIYINDILMSWM
jgi:hypothetical protein